MTAPTSLCPICEKAPSVKAYRPFCSRRCSDVDLQGWFSGKYRVASDEPDLPQHDREHDED